MGDRRRRASDIYDNETVGFDEPSDRESCCQKFNRILARIFHFPFLQPPPICFYRNENEEDNPHLDRLAAHEVEELVNFDSRTTKALYGQILDRRKYILKNKDLFLHQEIDLRKFPGWNQDNITRLRCTFQIFDTTRDGILDFAELNCVLSEFGDKTPSSLLKRYFYTLADDYGTIGFKEFLQFFYHFTMEPVDHEYHVLSNTLKKIDHNMEIRCSLDVISQLQGGLF